MSIIFTHENKNIKIYSMWAMFYQWSKIPQNGETFYIVKGCLVFVTFIHFMYIST